MRSAVLPQPGIAAIRGMDNFSALAYCPGGTIIDRPNIV